MNILYTLNTMYFRFVVVNILVATENKFVNSNGQWLLVGSALLITCYLVRSCHLKVVTKIYTHRVSLLRSCH